jgi:hypothetical protein
MASMTPASLGVLAAIVLAGSASVARAQAQTPPAAAQNPSPMQETTRAHERLTQRAFDGISRSFNGPAGKPVEVFIPRRVRGDAPIDVIIHFLGASWIPAQAIETLRAPTVVAVVNLGAGSSAYQRPFADPSAFDSLLAGVQREVAAAVARPMRIGRIALVGFSAGHGAVRTILRDPRLFARVDAVLLLDGMHTSYIPEGTPLASGGALDTTNLTAFAAFARAAIRGEKRFVVTHSAIFPGTFASTTETADWLLAATGLKRTAVLRWGPRGMQQLSEAHSGNFDLLGYAGNSAPDHIDQLHALPEMLAFTLGDRKTP